MECKERFWQKVDRTTGPEQCWPWTAADRGNGYGAFKHNGKVMSAHRVAYELTSGPIPDGLVIDHLCRNRGCCNPSHLEVVSHAENCRRGEGWAGKNSRQTHCASGHKLTPENIYRSPSKPNHRQCRVCLRKYEAARYRRNKNK